MGPPPPEGPRVDGPTVSGGVARGRLLPNTAAPREGERVEVLFAAAGSVVEHILSGSLARPLDFRQDHPEWVVVLAGGAVVDIAGERVELSAGDWIVIPTDTAHRVVSTDVGTEWLAVHLPPDTPPAHV